MAAPRYIRVSSTGPGLVEVIAATVGGALNAEKIPSLDATGRLDATMMPIGIGADTQSLPASEALSGGDFVNIWDNAGTVSARKADASLGYRADGFVLTAAAAAATALVYFEGSNNQLVGLTLGAPYYLSTAGAATTVVPTTTGHIKQPVGVSTSATSINFEPATEILLA